MAGTARSFAGIDVGTYGSKAVLVDEDSKVLATASRSHGMATPHPGWAEQDADEVWWADVCALGGQLASAAREQDVEIAGLAVSAIGPTCLPVDADGRPLRPAILYGIDTRASVEIAELEEELGAERVLRTCGSPLTSQAVGPKVRWLQRHEPAVWERTRGVLTAHSYLVLRLTGRRVVDAYSAAAQAPFFDLHAGEWSAELVEAVCPLRYLPEVVDSTETVGPLTREAAEATGLPQGLPVAAGTIDAAAEAVGAGVTAPGDMMVSYGTTAFLIQVLEQPVVSPRLWGGVWVDRSRAVLTGGMSTTGAITEWIRRELSDLDDEQAFPQLVAEAERSRPGANGVLLLPYFSGERTPISEPQARGVVAGLSLSTTRGDLMRAVFEAMGLGVRHHLEAMAEVGAPPSRLVAIGGGARSSTWVQAVSDATGMAQDVPAQSVGAAFGDALLAAVAIGHLTDVAAAADVVDVAERVEPDPGLRTFYDGRYTAYRQLFERTHPIVLGLQEHGETTT